MESLDENEELDDPISLVQDNFGVCIGFNDKEDNFIHIEDSDSDTDPDEVQKEYSSCRNKTFTLPVTFFDIQRNIKLLNKCRPLSIKIVDCDKYPNYYKNFTLRSSAIETIDSAVNICADSVIVSPLIKTEKDEDILGIGSKNCICVVDKNSERAFQGQENIDDIKQDHAENILYEIDHIVSKDSYIPEKKRFDGEKAGGSKKNIIQINFKGDNDLIELKVKPREKADDIVSDKKIKADCSNFKSKQKESNEGFGIEVYMRLVEKALKSFDADFDRDNKKEDEKYKNNNRMNGENTQSQINTSQKGRNNCIQKKDYSICNNTLSSSVKTLPYKVISKSYNDLNIRIQEVQNNTLPPLKKIQDNLQSLNTQVSSKHELKASKDVCYQIGAIPNDQNSTYQVYSLNSNVNNCCNTAQTNSFVTTGNSTHLLYQHDINKLQDGRPIQTFISNRSENLENKTLSVLRTVRPFGEKMSYRNCRLPNSSINYYYPNNLIHSASGNIYNCVNNSFSIRHCGNQNYVWSNIYPENYFYNPLSTLPRPPRSQTASPIQQFGMVSSNIKTLPKQQMRNLINVQDINNVRNIEVGAVPIGYGDRINNNTEALNNINKALLNRDPRNLQTTQSNKQNAIQSVLEISSSSSSMCSTRKRMLTNIIGSTTEKRKILRHSSKNEQNINKNLINIKKQNKGYSPPILPIMPHEKTLEMLEYKMKTISSNSNNINETSVTNNKYVHSNNHAIMTKILEIDENRENKSVKKTSLEEYKKRNFTNKSFVDLTTEAQFRKKFEEEAEELQNYVDLQDLGYDSDRVTYE